jgi:hypothetical protein
MTTIVRPASKAIVQTLYMPNINTPGGSTFAPSSPTPTPPANINPDWDTFFNSVQVALNNIQKTSSFTMPAAATLTVNDTRVTAASFIGLTPTNASAGTLDGGITKLYVSARTAGVSFTVTTANGGSATGSETFAYSIIG